MSPVALRKENMKDKKQNKDKKEEKSMLETIREVNRKERHEKMHRESERQRSEAEQKDKEKEAYIRKLEQDKRELIKIKQGLADDVQETVGETANYTFRQKVSGFLYCNKWLVVLGIFFIALAVFLIYDLAKKDRPDMTIMIVARDPELEYCYTGISDILDEYLEVDMNGNGEIHSTAYYMPVSPEENDPYTQQASSTKLFAIMQDGETLLVIGNDTANEFLFPDSTLENLEELYPENEHIKGFGFYLSGTKLAEDIGYNGDFPEDVYIGIRKVQKGARYRDKMQKNYDCSKAVLDKFIERYS